MKTQYEYIYMAQLPFKGKTTKWEIHHVESDCCLGVIKWYASWRQYCFFPENDTIFSSGCLQDIQDFIKKLMDDRNG